MDTCKKKRKRKKIILYSKLGQAYGIDSIPVKWSSVECPGNDNSTNHKKNNKQHRKNKNHHTKGGK